MVPQTQSPSTFAAVPSVIAQGTPARRQTHRCELLQEEPIGDAWLFNINDESMPSSRSKHPCGLHSSLIEVTEVS